MTLIYKLFLFILITGVPIFSVSAQQVTELKQLAEQANHLQEKRCMVCHGCYDAPCQLKLEAARGLNRGASKEKVYNGTRLRPGQMTRLFDDGYTQQQWRDKGFYPVVDQNHPERGVMYRMLELKQENPLPPGRAMYQDFDFSLNRDQQCPKQDEFDKFASDYPLWGMPYGLPGLNSDEHQLMTSWLNQGAPAPELVPLSKSHSDMVRKWEAFLNGGSNKEKLMSRYLYEHLFLAGLYLQEEENPVWFRLVRSHTRPGDNIDLISTRRPFDDPRSSEFYYRLERMPVAILDKRHMPYVFDRARMDWYRDLFLETDYEVPELPDYSQAMTDNPFVRFQTIPVESRYRFMLEEAQFSIMNFIKGPVCRGQIALSVIDDHFWVMFANPESNDPEQSAEFLALEADNMRLPRAKTGTPIDLVRWRRYAKAEQKYAAAKAKYLDRALDRAKRNLDVDDIWDGDGNNDNAALTVFRHFDTASVVKGFVGDTPKTAWVVNYPVLERIHYLLVAGFDVYGGASHQLESRLYMDFLRMEGEYNFLLFLPPEDRLELRDYWYREARSSVKKHYFGNSKAFQRDTDVVFETDDPKTEFLQRMRSRIYGASAEPYNYRAEASAEMIEAFEHLESNAGRHNSYMPQVSFVNIIGGKRDEVYTIIRNSAYLNISQPFGEQDRRLPDEDSLTVVRGFIGAYPNNFFQINEKQLPLFVEEVAALSGLESQWDLLERYGAKRSDPWFWRLSDKFHQMYREQAGVAAGIFDYNRYQHK